MASKYVIQVVEGSTGRVVQWAPGLAVERQLIDELCNRVAAKGVGLLRSTPKVVEAVRTSLIELLHELKSDVNP